MKARKRASEEARAKRDGQIAHAGGREGDKICERARAPRLSLVFRLAPSRESAKREKFKLQRRAREREK